MSKVLKFKIIYDIIFKIISKQTKEVFMDFKQTKEEADEVSMEFKILKGEAQIAILDFLKEYLDSGYTLDTQKSSDTAMYFTKLIDIDENALNARFARIQVAKNPIFTEENFLKEQNYDCKHPITPYLISTATVTEPIDLDNIFNLSEIEIALIEQCSGTQLTIPGFENTGLQKPESYQEKGE